MSIDPLIPKADAMAASLTAIAGSVPKIAREYATVAEADEATQWAINLRTAARLLRDYIREVPL